MGIAINNPIAEAMGIAIKCSIEIFIIASGVSFQRCTNPDTDQRGFRFERSMGTGIKV